VITLEDRLRIALRDTAAQVPPGTVRPLALPAANRKRPRRAGGPARRTLTALSAAAAVAGIAIAATVLAAGSPGHSGTPAPHRHSRPASGQDGGAPPPLPPYFLVLTGTGYPYYDNPLHAAIGATASGQTLATIAPPAPDGTFIAVTAAADDRTFVLAAQPWQPYNTSYAVGLNSGPVTFYLLRFSPGDSEPTLTPLPIPAVPASEQLAGLALRPDGAQLAVATDVGMNSQQITVYSVRTGAARTWTADVPNAPLGGMGPGAQNMVDPQALSWTADGSTLAYQDTGSTQGVELLDVSGTSGSLLADSRLVVPQTSRGCVADAMITPDGSALVCAVFTPVPTAPGGVPAGSLNLGFAEFSADTGAQLRVFDEQSTASTNPFAQQVLWSSPSGDELITESALPYWNRVSVLTAGTLTLLPPADQPAVPAVVW
jgi:hypothetical protein